MNPLHAYIEEQDREAHHELRNAAILPAQESVMLTPTRSNAVGGDVPFLLSFQGRRVPAAPISSNTPSLRPIYISEDRAGLHQEGSRLLIPTLDSPIPRESVLLESCRPSSALDASEFTEDSLLFLAQVSPSPVKSKKRSFSLQPRINPSSRKKRAATCIEQEEVHETGSFIYKRTRDSSFVSLDTEVHGISSPKLPPRKGGLFATIDYHTELREDDEQKAPGRPVKIPRIFRPTIRRATVTDTAKGGLEKKFFLPSRQSAFWGGGESEGPIAPTQSSIES